jgi:cation transport ATPase
LRAVSLLKDRGPVVGTTRADINDAPALKRVDVGVAIGPCGTDVAKEGFAIFAAVAPGGPRTLRPVQIL